MGKKMKNKRLRERAPFKTDIILSMGKEKKSFSNTRDISMSGLFVEADNVSDILPMGSEGKIEIFLIFGESKILIKGKFRVMRVVDLEKDKNGKILPVGFGIELFAFEGDSSVELFNVLKYNLKEDN
jgi:hypothetical protein